MNKRLITIAGIVTLLALVVMPTVKATNEGSYQNGTWNETNKTGGSFCKGNTCYISTADEFGKTSTIKQVSTYCMPVRLPSLVWYNWCIF
jgi:hypothetical protein